MVRFKNRWLLLSLDFPSQPSSSSSPAAAAAAPPPPNLTSHTLQSLIRASLLAHFGPAASGALGGPLAVKYYSPATRLAIVRVARVGEGVVRAACTLLASVAAGGGEAVPLRATCVGVSGTVKKLQERVIRMDRRIVAEGQGKVKRKAKVKAKSAQRRNAGGAVKGKPAQQGEDTGVGVGVDTSDGAQAEV